QLLPMIQALVENAEKRQVTDKVVRIWISHLKETVDQAVDFLEDFTNKAYPYLLLEMKHDIPSRWLSIRSVSTSTEKVRKVLEVLENAAADGLKNLHLKEEAGHGGNAVSDERATGSFAVESEGTEPEDIGDDYFKELSWMSFFEEIEIDCKILVTTRSEKEAMIIDPNQLSSYHLKGLADDDCWALFERRAFRQGDQTNQLPELHLIQNLRHLNIAGCDRLDHMPNGIEELHHLQTLPMYLVSRLSNLESLGLCWGFDDNNLIMNPTKKGSLSWLQMGKKDHDPQPQPPEPSRGTRDPMDGKLAEDVLACLQPHKNLESLHILGYPGLAFPRTFSKWLLPKLSTVELINCRDLLCLPTLGHLLGLKTLRIEGMNKVEDIGPEFYSENSIVAFSSLQELHLKDFPVLESWCSVEDRSIFPLLRKLTIKNCPNLMLLPVFSSLQHLSLYDCNSRILDPVSFQKLTSLKSLEITECHTVSILGDEFEGLTSLKTLSIENCSNLGIISTGLQYLTALESLTVMYCSNLASLPDSFHHLSLLKRLTLINCTELQILPESLKFATQLQSLQLHSCYDLSALPEWFDTLLSLRSLAISDCQKMTCLPVALRRLTGLQHLSIHRCPALKQRCWPHNGVDWWKISHIHHVHIP
nr:hypothetical protein [Tanacetum cinerariifolium]